MPVSNNLKNTNDVKVSDNKSTDARSKKTSVLNSNSTTDPGNTESRSTKVTDTCNDMKSSASDDSQGANVQNNNSGAAGAYCITEHNKNTVTLPHTNEE